MVIQKNCCLGYHRQNIVIIRVITTPFEWLLTRQFMANLWQTSFNIVLYCRFCFNSFG